MVSPGLAGFLRCIYPFQYLSKDNNSDHQNLMDIILVPLMMKYYTKNSLGNLIHLENSVVLFTHFWDLFRNTAFLFASPVKRQKTTNCNMLVITDSVFRNLVLVWCQFLIICFITKALGKSQRTNINHEKQRTQVFPQKKLL